MKIFRTAVTCSLMMTFFCSANLFAAEDIFEAIRVGNIPAVQKLTGKETVKSKNKEGDTPLQYAAKKSRKPEIINILINAGADVEGKNKDGYTPLMLAVKDNSGAPETAVALINNKADVNAAFHKPYDDKNKFTPLMYAVSEASLNKLQAVQALVGAGADVNAKSSEGWTPMLLAARTARDPEVINILVKAGADIEERSKSGLTPLMLAVKNNPGAPDIAIALIENKADVNAVFHKPYDSDNNTTALMYAVSEGSLNKPKVIQALIDYGADVSARNEGGLTPLLLAAGSVRNAEVIDILLKAGANIEDKDKDGYTPLMRALRYRQSVPDIAITLILNNADVNVKIDGTLVTPLMAALDDFSSTKENVLQALIDYGADINAANSNGQTPLMFAAKDKDRKIVKLLIANKADPKAKDKEGKTAEDYLKSNSRIKEKALDKL